MGPTVDARLLQILGFFSPAVLAAYREQPDKYMLTTDQFEGRVTVTSAYFAQLDDAAQDSEYIDVKFGYRTLKNGDLAIAVYLPDLVDHSSSHVDRWRPFIVASAEWLEDDQDLRFSRWYRRYLEGDWNVENGPAFQIGSELKLINGLTREAAGVRLFAVDDPNIPYPAAQNTHRYEDAHRELYGVLIDALDKHAIEELSKRLGRPINAQNSRTRDALQKIIPAVGDPVFASPLENISAQRRLASHKVRPPAKPMRAFEQFTADLESCYSALRHLRTKLESELNMDALKAMERQDALSRLPRIVRPPEANYSINEASRMEGRTITKVEFGFREDIEGVHQSEALLIHFSDGAIMGIETGSNARNVSGKPSQPEDFHVDFRMHWVPPTVTK
jgi:hypothetical protein